MRQGQRELQEDWTTGVICARLLHIDLGLVRKKAMYHVAARRYIMWSGTIQERSALHLSELLAQVSSPHLCFLGYTRPRGTALCAAKGHQWLKLSILESGCVLRAGAGSSISCRWQMKHHFRGPIVTQTSRAVPWQRQPCRHPALYRSFGGASEQAELMSC